MRDNLKDKKYFDDFISLNYNLINKKLEKLENNQIKEDRIPSVMKRLADFYKSILKAKYSRGDNFKSNFITQDLENVIYSMDKYWTPEHMFIIKKNNKPLKQYSLTGYFSLLEILSLGILLDISKNTLNLIVNFIDKDSVKDLLYEFLINSISEREPIKNESYSEFFGINEKFSILKEIIIIEQKEIAEKKLKDFLENNWFNSLKNESVFGLHTNPNNTYAGYWCFIAAAIVKIKSLDDSSFRDNKYYPKDL